MEKLVSIGMPVYNDKAFLQAALQSLLTQSYFNIELIISDDCSSDGSQKICEEAVQSDSRVKYIRQPYNIGISRNMSFLLSQATGKYFMWAANDDLWHPDFIKELVMGIEEHPDSVVAFCGVQDIDEKNNFLQVHHAAEIDYRGESAEVRLKRLIRVFYDGFGYGLFKKEMIENVSFPVWWWVNRNCAYDNIYPTLAFYLTKGNYISCGTVPLWYNRMKDGENVHHKIPFENSFIRGYLATALRKFNLVAVTINEIRRAGGGFLLILKVLPSLFYYWFFNPVFHGLAYNFKRLSKGEIKFW